MNAPEGFKPLFRTSPVLDLIGPIYYRGHGRDLVLGLRVEQKHCNARGTVHGGILAALADVALGYTMAFATDPPTALITANLTLDFAGTAKVGDWLETSVDVQKQGSRLAFGNCFIAVAGERVVRASAVFLVSGELNARSEI
ncbi:MAG: PaaI family thioesterase [Candidatus Rokubacteria bacterium]|nr:PaaI family thioesterase [Candidatus Rokubacteria bacterium]